MKSSWAMPRRRQAGAELFGHAVRVGERRQALCLGGPLDLQPVLVGTGEEMHVVAEEAVPARASASPMIVV